MVGQSFREVLAKLLLDEEVDIEISPVVADAARINVKRPANLTFSVPDDWVKNLHGSIPSLVDGYLAVRIPREAIIELDKNATMQEESPMEVTPNEVNETLELLKEN